VSGWYWIAAGVLLAIAESQVPGITLIWLGGAAAIVGVIALAWPDLIWPWQVFIFAILAAAAVATGLKLQSRTAGRQPAEVNLGAQRLVGEKAALESAIVNGHGQVRIGDSVWPVSGPDLPAGASVVVTGSDGITLKVAPV
jgi:inner membrane protein